MLEKVKYFIVLFSIFLMFPQLVLGSDEFETSFYTIYDISTSGVSTVTQNIKLTNKLSNVYATKYALEIGSTRIDDVLVFDKAGNKVNNTVTNTENKTIIVSNFENKTVGKGQTLDFTVRYKNLDVAQKTGQILEINIPKVSQESQIDNYKVVLNVPSSFKQPKIITPNQYKQTSVGGNTVLSFESDQILTRGITAIFGESQFYDFSLTYNLENPTVSNAITQVALPPDTNFQKIFLNSFTKNPEKIEYDDDGNWIATFKLEPKEKNSIVVSGSAIVYIDPVVKIKAPEPNFSNTNLKSQKYWDTNNTQIQALAEELKTPENIYNYLVKNFSYNYDRINSGIGRLGSIDAIEHPDNAICTEFTDTFIAIARAAGIPSREINGFANTQNSILKPLSLVQDVLHAWPEYYDYSKNIWIPIDPTWGSTTGGIDYFNHLDFNHFTLAIHGSSSERPYPAGYYKFENSDSKDLEINFSNQPPEQVKDFIVDFEESKFNVFSNKTNLKVKIKNISNIAISDQKINITSSDANILSNREDIVNFFLPHSEYSFAVKLETTGNKSKLFINIDQNEYSYEIKNSINLQQIKIITIGIALAGIFAAIAYKSWSVLVSKRKK